MAIFEVRGRKLRCLEMTALSNLMRVGHLPLNLTARKLRTCQTVLWLFPIRNVRKLEGRKKRAWIPCGSSRLEEMETPTLQPKLKTLEGVLKKYRCQISGYQKENSVSSANPAVHRSSGFLKNQTSKQQISLAFLLPKACPLVSAKPGLGSLWGLTVLLAGFSGRARLLWGWVLHRKAAPCA